MKTISIPNSVYAAIWARATEDDETEADILRRVLGISQSPAHQGMRPPMASPPPTTTDKAISRRDIVDGRSGVIFPEGFRIFRVYKGKPHEAVVREGHWHLDGSSEPIRSLNILSAAIGAKTENAWTGWRFERDGEIDLIDALRDRKSIHHRSNRNRDNENE